MHSSSSSPSSSVEIIDADAFRSRSTDPDHRRADAAAADSPFPRSVADHIASSLRTQEAVDAVCKKYGVLAEFAARPAGDLRACSAPPPGAACVYARALEAGMRLPLHPFACELLRHLGVAPSQITPNGWRVVAGFLLLSHHAAAPPSLAVFRRFFRLFLSKLNGWYHFRGKRGAGADGVLFTGLPKLKGWKGGFFFVSSPSPWPCQVRWGGPPPSKSSTAEPVLSGEEMELAGKLLHLHGGAAVDLRTYLCESNLAAVFSSNLAGAAPPQPPPPRPARAKGKFPFSGEFNAQKVKTEPESDMPWWSPLSGKKRGFEAEENNPPPSPTPTPPAPHGGSWSWSASGMCSPPPGFAAHVPDKHDGDSADWKAARQLLQAIVTPSRERRFPAAKPSDVVASSYLTLLQAANYASFSFGYALELEEKLRARERDAAAEADAVRKELEEKALRELAAAKAAAVQEYLRSDEHRRELAAHALEGYERGMERRAPAPPARIQVVLDNISHPVSYPILFPSNRIRERISICISNS
ncbi:uncharacterized protein [Oryza sativa Japonica Group]|uniref:uncharacterized protein n=1 Tax=Oryza sativa subsp. japonica TaxID=39947 RepID=UPI000E1C1F7F|nr:uncharacterized protein LOC4340280 [Oryza sativa Japonica Group]